MERVNPYSLKTSSNSDANVEYIMDYANHDPNEMTKSDMIEEICGLRKCVSSLMNKAQMMKCTKTCSLEKDKTIKQQQQQINELYTNYLVKLKELEKEQHEHEGTKMNLQKQQEKYDNMNGSFTHNVRLCVAQEYSHLLSQINALSEKVRTLQAELNKFQNQKKKATDEVEK